MHDVMQQGLESLASQNMVTRDVAILCATALLYLLAVAWIVLLAWRRARLSVAVIARIAVLALLAYVVSVILTGVIADPRPYIVTHTQPLTPVGHDNGFPSDHTLLAAALTASLWWFARRAIPLFAIGTLLVALGRLGIGAHHTLDVVGSIVIAVIAALIAGALPLPAPWSRPLLPTAWPSGERARAGALEQPRHRTGR